MMTRTKTTSCFSKLYNSFCPHFDLRYLASHWASRRPIRAPRENRIRPYNVTVNDFCKISQLERVIDRLLFFFWLNTFMSSEVKTLMTGNKRTEYLFTWYKPILNVKTIFLAILYCVKMEGKSDFFPINYLCITRLYIKAPWCYEKYT